MAKIKYSALVSEMTGKLNGSTLQRGQYGNVLHAQGNRRRTITNQQAASLPYRQAGLYTWDDLDPLYKSRFTDRAASTPFYDAYNQPYYYTPRGLWAHAWNKYRVLHGIFPPDGLATPVPQDVQMQVNFFDAVTGSYQLQTYAEGNDWYNWVAKLAYVQRFTVRPANVPYRYVNLWATTPKTINYHADDYPQNPRPQPGGTWFLRVELWDVSIWRLVRYYQSYDQYTYT